MVPAAHCGTNVRHSQSLYSSKQSWQVQTGENRSRPHAWARREEEKPFKEPMSVSVTVSGREVMASSDVDGSRAAAYAIDGHNANECTSGHGNVSDQGPSMDVRNH